VLIVDKHPQNPLLIPYNIEQDMADIDLCGRPCTTIEMPRISVAVILAVKVPNGNEGIMGLNWDTCQRHSAPEN
jgi:hypothetical protein